MINIENELNSNNLFSVFIIFSFLIIFVNQIIHKKKITRERIIVVISSS